MNIVCLILLFFVSSEKIFCSDDFSEQEIRNLYERSKSKEKEDTYSSSSLDFETDVIYSQPKIFLNEPYIIRSVFSGEYFYNNDKKERVRFRERTKREKDDHEYKKDLQWKIKNIRGDCCYIKSVLSDQYLFYDDEEDERGRVRFRERTKREKDDHKYEKDLQWKIIRLDNRNYIIKSVLSNKYLFYDDKRCHARFRGKTEYERENHKYEKDLQWKILEKNK